ncbi:MAG: Hsp20/alpha crystallin family protein [Calothrix sp. MO_192.B10]|nr:Hsp20/alpha crystallin family protein [Calothrix sp. MO_192.B10]
MAITRWQPLRDIEMWEPIREMESLRDEMNYLFEKFMHPGNGGSKGITFRPAVEMEETDDEISLKLEIPGLDIKDIEIQASEDGVSISGERKSETKTEEKGMMRSEFHYGRFERSIHLPAHIQNDKVKAEYHNGILSLTLPKSEIERKKVVKVNVS